jgi:seryl-tRNA(Sec) selenium transferase
MKLDRQEVVAVYAALREWLTMNHEDRLASYEARIYTLRQGLEGIPHVELADYPGGAPSDGLRISVDAGGLGKSASDVVGELRSGKPSIWVREDGAGESFIVRMPTLKEGGEMIIAARLREILQDAAR